MQRTSCRAKTMQGQGQWLQASCVLLLQLNMPVLLLLLLQGSKLSLHLGDAEDPDVVSDVALLPDTEALADRPKPCLTEAASLPRDWARLFDGQLYGLGAQHNRPSLCAYTHIGSVCMCVCACVHVCVCVCMYAEASSRATWVLLLFLAAPPLTSTAPTSC